MKTVVSEVFLEDCIVGMARYPDKFFDLAIVDPPYGIHAEQGTNRASRRQFADKKYGWDSSIPDKAYFSELFRVSKHQIIWGGNYFLDRIASCGHPVDCRCFLIWDKLNPDRCFADGEMAWTSFDQVARIYKARPQTLNKKDHGKIHPTQKPIDLYRWLLLNYGEADNKILDTHMGSQSSRIAAYQLGFDYYGWEIDKDYFDAGNKRFKDSVPQLDMFDEHLYFTPE